MSITKTAKWISQLSLQLMVLFIIYSGVFVEQVNAQVGTWTPLNRLAPDANNGVMILMTDGSVICHTVSGGNQGDGTIWDKLTPDSTGSYVNGTWSTIAPMTQERYSFSSEVLKNGRVYAAGGEYGTDGTQNGWHGEIYDPTTDTWTEANGANANNVISDGNCKMLDNGKVLQALVDVSFPVHTVVYSPVTNAYATGPSTLHGDNESMWLKLPDNSVLFVDEDAQTSERYIPSLNQWVADGNVPVALFDPFGFECGPGWMLPNGKAFFIGGTNHTAIYTPSGTNAPGTWVAGPDVPNGYGMPDAPGAMLVNGNILFACSPQPTQNTEFATPTIFYEFNYLNNSFTPVSAPSNAAANAISQQYTMLDLPNGQVLIGMDQDNSSAQYYVYTPTGTPLAVGKPVISQVTRLTCTNYMITGHGFNGISEGSAFGDENENDSNYPLFRFKSGNKVYYARSYNWNSTGVQRGTAPDTAYFTLPATMSGGAYYLYAVANGIASDSILFTDSVPSLSSALNPSVCTGTAFTYAPASSTPGATFTWTRAAVAGISNAAITTPQTANPNEVLINTTSLPITVIYAYSVTGLGCSNEVNVSVVVNPRPTAAFTAFPTTACSLPDSVSFTNTTVAGGSYTWHFGDGNTSSATSPVHAYLTAGTFSVKLVATSACGIDSITHTNFIVITPPSAPVATSPVNIACSGSATLNATGSDTLKWFNQPTGGNLLGTGTTYVTPILTANTTYYVESYVSSAPSFCPPASNAFGTGGNYTNSNFRSDIFNVNQPCTLVSVLVVSGAAGNRTIQLQDSAGNVLQSSVINIPNGTSTVTLNFPLTVGTGYQLGCGDNSTTTNLYRNATGAAFPYSDPGGYITITGNNVPDAVHFYFFYEWKLQGASCVSARTPVAVNIANGLTLTPNITNVPCFGGTGSATVSVSGGTPAYTYLWSNNATTATISNVAAGTYTVTSTDAHGCSSSASEIISQPASALNVSTTPVNAGCGQSNGSVTASATGGTSGYSYSWNNTGTGPAINNLSAGSYVVTVTDANNCTSSASANVSNPTSFIETHTSTGLLCNGNTNGSASVNVTGGAPPFTYHWNTGASSASLSNLPGGVYSVTITDANNCQKIDTVVVNQPPLLYGSIIATNDSCFGNTDGTASINPGGGTPPYNGLLWNTGATTSTITGLATGNYSVTITDANNCTVTENVAVTEPAQLAVTTDSVDATGGQSNGSAMISNTTGGTSPYTYLWSTGATTSTITGVPGGNYTVTITDAYGCTLLSSVTVVSTITGVPNVGAGISFTLSPNPASDQLTVTLDKTSAEMSVSMKNVLGQTLVNKAITDQNTTLNISLYANGVYFVEVKQGDKQAVKQFIISK